MSSISEEVLKHLDQIIESYGQHITKPNDTLTLLSDRVRDEQKLVLSFSPISPMTTKSLIAVDGGNAEERLSGGDLIVAGATLGEGLNTLHLYNSPDDYPAEVFSDIFPHMTANTKVQKSVRAALELIVLQKAKADYKIIDGAYIGNVAEVLYGLIDDHPVVSNTLLELNWFDDEHYLRDALNTVLYPPRSNDSGIFAVVKSDSSTVYVKTLAQEYSFLNDFIMTDRMLSSRLLRPGEFFTPRSVESDLGLVSSLKKKIGMEGFGKKSSNKLLLFDMIRDKAEALTRLSTIDPTEEGVLWTTYFKPTQWSVYHNTVKIEFPYYYDKNETVEEHARKIIQIIDQDIMDGNILEPWCQYYADKRAKDVSPSINIIKNHLVSTLAPESALKNIVRNYRT